MAIFDREKFRNSKTKDLKTAYGFLQSVFVACFCAIRINKHSFTHLQSKLPSKKQAIIFFELV